MHSSATAEPATTDRQGATGEPVGQVGPDRADRFLARVDAHLAGLTSPQSKLRFLDMNLAAWNRAYARFICSEGDSEPTFVADDPPHCSDFLLTITGLAARRSLLEEPKS